jgi:hypothetical protein
LFRYNFKNMEAESLQIIRKQLVNLLDWDRAHVSFREAVDNVPYAFCYKKPDGLPHSIWDLVYHCRMAQWDILEYSLNPRHNSPKWPEAYWPESEKIPTEEEWSNILQMYFSELDQIKAIIENPDTDLFKPFSDGSGHNIFREAVLLADHTAYHVGQIVLVRKALGIW